MKKLSKSKSKSDWIDISIPVRDGMVHWPGDPPVAVRRVQDIARGDSHTLSAISIGSHTGTHIDAPAHFLKGGETVDRVRLSVLVGKARVLELKGGESIKLSDVVSQKIRSGERILFKTTNSASLWQSDKFTKDFVCLSAEAAEFIADRGVKLVGVDYLSVGGYKSGSSQHKTLLAAGVCIVEGLNLSGVPQGYYHFICLPLRLEAGDGAPARAIIRPY